MWGSRARVIFEYQSKAYEASAADREAQKTSREFLENAAYEAALRRMMNEVEFVQLKSGLELKHNLKLMTVYPELKLMTTVQEKK